MAKKESTFLNMSLTLLIVTAVAALALGGVYNLTKEPIEKAERDYLYKQINVVVPGAADADIRNFKVKSIDLEDSLDFYEVTKDGEFIGMAVKTFTKKGFSGKFKVVVGFDKDGKIKDSNILEHKETPGLGDKMDKAKANWNDQYKGLDPATVDLRVKKDGGEIDAITAATISSRAYSDAIQRAYDTYMNYIKTKGGAE